MAHFTVRVELHETTPGQKLDYEILHTEMKNEGFTRTIYSENVFYKLPPAEYSKIGEFTTKQVLDSAKTAATKTKYKFSILVNNIYGREGFNLEVVKHQI